MGCRLARHTVTHPLTPGVQGAGQLNQPSQSIPFYLVGSSRVELMRFSTARMTPSLVQTPTAVEPSCVMVGWRGRGVVN